MGHGTDIIVVAAAAAAAAAIDMLRWVMALM